MIPDYRDLLIKLLTTMHAEQLTLRRHWLMSDNEWALLQTLNEEALSRWADGMDVLEAG